MKNFKILLPVLLSFVLSACTMQVNSTIRHDGSNDLRIEMGFSASDKEMLSSMSSGAATDICSQMESESSDLPAGTSFTSEERGDETWCIMTITYNSLDELQSMLEEGEGITVNQLEITNDRLYYDLSVDMSTEQFDMGGYFPMVMKWQVTVPGKVGDNNADEVNGKTLTWELPAGKISTIQVESALSGGSFPKWTAILIPILCLCCFGFLIVVGVVIFVLIRKQKGKKSDGSGSDLPGSIEIPTTAPPDSSPGQIQ